MKRQAVYWIIGLVLAGLWGLQTWQYRQEQRQAWLRLRLLDATLQIANARARAEAQHMVDDTETTVKRIGNFPAARQVAAQSDSILSETTRLVASLHTARTQLLHRVARPQQVADIAGYENVVATVLAPTDSAGLAAQLHRQVVAYSRNLRQLKQPDSPLAIRQASDQLLVQAGANSPRNWPFYYEGASLTEALTMLTQLETAVWIYATAALEAQVTKVVYCGGTSDRVGVAAVPATDTVAVGEKYRARLFLSARLEQRPHQMLVNGRPIPIASDGSGQVEFVVPPSAIAHGTATVYWIGKVKTRIYGQDSTFTVRVPYVIRAR